MPVDVSVERVPRDRILDLRGQEYGGPHKGSRTFSRDLADTTRHWAALLNGEVVGCVSVMRLRGHALRGMVVAEAHRRRGIGARLLHVVCAEVDAPMWCNARLEAVPFYRRMGWDEVGPVFELRDLGAHRRMTWRRTVRAR